MPRHIAFIMDGNGRWARRRALARINGHERGADVLRAVTEFGCAEGISEVTFYALSTENFTRRPRREVQGLLRLLKRFLISERPTIERNDIRLRVIGRTAELPDDVQQEIDTSLAESANNQGMILRLALNYGSRQEILDAVAKLGARVAAGELAPEALEGLSEADFARYLYDPDMTDPDLLIRTAGEFRMSNFLLWQLSYSELYIADVTWPEFTVDHVREAIAVYGGRERKFGSLPTASAVGEE